MIKFIKIRDEYYNPASITRIRKSPFSDKYWLDTDNHPALITLTKKQLLKFFKDNKIKIEELKI